MQILQITTIYISVKLLGAAMPLALEKVAA